MKNAMRIPSLMACGLLALCATGQTAAADVYLTDPSPGLHEYACEIVHVSGTLTGNTRVLVHGGQIIVDGWINGVGPSDGSNGANGCNKTWACSPTVSPGAGGAGDSGFDLSLEIDEWCDDFTNSIDVYYGVDLRGRTGGNGGYGDFAAMYCDGTSPIFASAQTGGAGGDGGDGGDLTIVNDVGPVYFYAQTLLYGGVGGNGGSGGSVYDGGWVGIYPAASAAAGNGTLGGEGGRAGSLTITAPGQYVELASTLIWCEGGLGGNGGSGGSSGTPPGQSGEGGPGGYSGNVTIHADEIVQTTYAMTVVCVSGLPGNGGEGGYGTSESCNGCWSSCSPYPETNAYCSRDGGKAGGRTGACRDGGDVEIIATSAVTLHAEIYAGAGYLYQIAFQSGGRSGASGTFLSGTCGDDPCVVPYSGVLGPAGVRGGNGGSIRIEGTTASDLSRCQLYALGGPATNGGYGGQRYQPSCSATELPGAQGGEGAIGGDGGSVWLQFTGYVDLTSCVINVCGGSGGNGGNGGGPSGLGGPGRPAGTPGDSTVLYGSASTSGFVPDGTCTSVDGNDGAGG